MIVFGVYVNQPADISSREELILEECIYLKQEDAEKVANELNAKVEEPNKRYFEKLKTNKYSTNYFVQEIEIK